MNINLVVVNGNGDDVWLDLYEEQPIKLTFNIEDIVTATPKAEFSRQFRIPATDVNYDFFTTAFEINGVDFNPGLKYPARIVVEGSDFREGELRLLNIYKNDTTHKVDYECVFLGTTKALATEIGEKRIGELDWTDYVQIQDMNVISGSWEAYPVGGLTDGIFDGNLLFPLVDFGNTYDSSGNEQETRIAVAGGSQRFTQNSAPLKYTRFKPMVRFKEVMRRIFEQHGFTYTGQFLTTNNEVTRMYLSAWGNDEAVVINENNSNLAKWGRNTDTEYGGQQGGYVPFDVIYSDPGNNITYTSAFGFGNRYEVPFNGNYTFNQFYDLTFKHVEGTFAQWEFIFTGVASYRFTLNAGSGVCAGVASSFEVEKDTGGGYASIYYTCEFDGFIPGDGGQPDQFVYNYSFGDTTAAAFSAGDFIGTYYLFPFLANDPGNEISVNGGTYTEITSAVGEFSVAPLFDNDYKCVDLIKDAFTMFRLVMVPDSTNPSNFYITPWNDYIGRGQLKDWSSKLCHDKDIVVKPLLLEQPDRVTFTLANDTDHLNDENYKIFDEVFGTRKLDSTYEILDGEKEYKTKIASTPATQIEGYNADWEDYLIPQIHLHEFDNGVLQHRPIKPKTRLLYYSGLKSNGTSLWYTEDASATVESWNEFPCVSYTDQMPQGGPNNKSLLFERELTLDQSGTALNTFGQDLYGRYWSKYLELLYNKDSRRVTAYFVLDADDILNFRYNDVIFVDGVYYYIEKIYDAPLGQKAKVKVDLITLKNYRPIVTPVPPVDLLLWEDANTNWENETSNWESV